MREEFDVFPRRFLLKILRPVRHNRCLPRAPEGSIQESTVFKRINAEEKLEL